jgi:hypothetical protein
LKINLFVALSLYDLIWKTNKTLKIIYHVNTTMSNVTSLQ